MKTAKISAPFPTQTGLHRNVLERAVGGKNTIFTIPAGFLDTGNLAALFAERQVPAAWLRLGPEDGDPATLLVGLASAVQAACPGVGTRAIELLRQQPGGLYGWAPLFASLAHEISAGRPRPGALVLEGQHALEDWPETLDLLWYHFITLLPAGMARILTRRPLSRSDHLPGFFNQLNETPLRLNDNDSQQLIRKMQSTLPLAAARRLVALSAGRGEVLGGLLSICVHTGSAAICRAAEQARDGAELMASAVRLYLDASQPGVAELLWLALQTDYLHPDMMQAVLCRTAELPGEFLQPLAGGWMHLRGAWRQPIQDALRWTGRPETPPREEQAGIIERASGYLVRQGEYELAINLLFEQNHPEEASQFIVQVGEQLLDRGQWQTLSGWLDRLPARTRRAWPWLVYAEGELSAVQGHLRSARRVFASATRLFHERQDPKGACQSMLMESGLAAWQGDMNRAIQYAYQAQALAESYGLVWHQGWAGWQLGALSVYLGSYEEALMHFTSAAAAAAAIEDRQMIAYTGQARLLVQAQVELRKKKEAHRQALVELENAEERAAIQTRMLVERPKDGAENLLAVYGWSRLPLMLKMPPPAAIPLTGGLDRPRPSATSALTGLLRNLFNPPAGGKNAGAFQLAPPPPTFSENPPESDSLPRLPADRSNGSPPVRPDGFPALAVEDGHLKQSSFLEPRQPEPETPFDPGEPQRMSISAYLLGNFRVIIDETPVAAWPNGRGRAVFAFLLAQRGRPVQREKIMDSFWPEAGPEPARNSLNVALYHLRQALKEVTDQPVVIFEENAYRLSPDFTLWLDIDAFEKHVKTGRERERQNRPAEAIQEYEAALSLYQGDLLVDDPYEDWQALEREQLRVLYLETLDRLSLIYFNAGQYAASINLCQFLLARDTCREDAHCRLMRCYSRQDQYHLALRQYQVCVEALESELNVDPSPATRRLYEQIRQRLPV